MPPRRRATTPQSLLEVADAARARVGLARTQVESYVPSPPTDEVTDERIRNALANDRFFYKFLCTTFCTPFFDLEYNMTRHPEIYVISHSRSRMWRDHIALCSIPPLVGQWRNWLYTRMGSDGESKIFDLVRDLITYQAGLRAVWSELFEQQIQMYFEQAVNGGDHQRAAWARDAVRLANAQPNPPTGWATNGGVLNVPTGTVVTDGRIEALARASDEMAPEDSEA